MTLARIERVRVSEDMPLEESRVTWARDGRWGFAGAAAGRDFQMDPSDPPVGGPDQDALVA